MERVKHWARIGQMLSLRNSGSEVHGVFEISGLLCACRDHRLVDSDVVLIQCSMARDM